MTHFAKIVEDIAAGVSVGRTVEGLSAIHQPECAAAVWQRQSAPRFTAWLNALEPELLPQARVVLRPELVREALVQICDIAGTPDCEERALLVEDANNLAEVFAGLMKAPYLRLRLQPVSTNACRRFHRDAVTARLVCTYRGTGTQYGVSYDGADPDPIFTLAAASPIILRGTLWPEDPKSGVLHRSPPIEGTGETRLVLVLDPVFDLEDAE